MTGDSVLDYVLGEFAWYRRWRGGTWFYASCPDGGWFRHAANTGEKTTK